MVGPNPSFHKCESLSKDEDLHSISIRYAQMKRNGNEYMYIQFSINTIIFNSPSSKKTCERPFREPELPIDTIQLSPKPHWASVA